MSHIDEYQGIADVINTLNDRTWRTRRQASDTLIELGKPAVLPLMAAIRQNAFTVFTLPEAVRALGGMRDEQAVDLLIEELEGRNVHAVQEAIKGLGHIGSPQAIQPLIDVFRHDWDDEETITAWQEAESALAAIGEQAIQPLLAALQDEDDNVREGAAKALQYIQNRSRKS
jgi:HEAT repeat protein